MKVTVNVQPLSWGHCGTKHYLMHLLPEMARQSPQLRMNFVSDRPVELPTVPLRMKIIPPMQRTLKHKLIWEAIAFPLGTLNLGAELVHIPFQAAMIKLRQPKVMTVHDTIIWESDVKRTELFYFGLVRRAAVSSKLILTVSEFSKQKIVEILNVNPDKVVVTPIAPSSDFAAPAPEEQVQRFRERYNLTRPYLVYVGGTAVRKGIPNLIRAYYGVRPDLRAEFDLVIVGPMGHTLPHHIEAHEELAKPLLEGAIHLIGEVSQEDLPAAYTGSSAFIFPSVSEGFGLSPLEAMGCGSPVMASNRTSMPEVVGDAAMLFDPEDVEDMTYTICTVLGSADLRASLRERGFQRVAKFNWGQTARLTLAAYEKALSL